MAAAAANFNEVGQHFVKFYYEKFSADRAALRMVYCPESMLSWEDKQFRGADSIIGKFGTLPAAVSFKIITVDYQPSVAGGVLIFVLGDLSIDNGPPMKFSHMHVGEPVRCVYATQNGSARRAAYEAAFQLRQAFPDRSVTVLGIAEFFDGEAGEEAGAGGEGAAIRGASDAFGSGPGVPDAAGNGNPRHGPSVSVGGGRAAVTLFFISTAGQGDFPHDMHRFFRAYIPRAAEPLVFAVFGLGDSRYANYNLAARKLRLRLLRLPEHAEFFRLGLGDEQHPLGWEDEFDPWMRGVVEALRARGARDGKNGSGDLPDAVGAAEPGGKEVIAVSGSMSDGAAGGGGSWSPEAATEIATAADSAAAAAAPTPDSFFTDYDLTFCGAAKAEASTLEGAGGSGLRNLQPLKSRRYVARVLRNDRLTSPDARTPVHHLTFAVSPRPPAFRCGDCMRIRPRQPPDLVRRFLECLGLDPEARCCFAWARASRLNNRPAVPEGETLSLSEAFGAHFDISAPASRPLFRYLAHCSSDALYQDRLRELGAWGEASSLALFHEYCKSEQRSVADVVMDFAAGLDRGRVDLARLCTLIPPTLARKYSIASAAEIYDWAGWEAGFAVSSFRGRVGIAAAAAQRLGAGGRRVAPPHLHESGGPARQFSQGRLGLRAWERASRPQSGPSVGRRPSPPGGAAIVDLCVAKTSSSTPLRRTRPGLCSHFLCDLPVGAELPLDPPPLEPGFSLGSAGALPPPDAPLLAVATGAGIAPVRALLQERAIAAHRRRLVGEATLIFGCRHPERDFLFSDELERMHEERSIQLLPAFSRLSPDRCVYVQNVIDQRAKEVAALLNSDSRAVVLVCGKSHPMPAQVAQALNDALGDGVDHAALMVRSQRLIFDTWG